MSVFLHLLTGIVALIAYLLACQAIYGFVLSFQRWTVRQRVVFVALIAWIGVVSFLLIWMSLPYAELWVIELWAIALTMYVGSCFAIWLNRKSDHLPISTWRLRALVLMAALLFYFAANALSVKASGGIISFTLAEFAVSVPFVYGCLLASLLSYRGLKKWAHTVLVVQACWCIAYITQFDLLAKFVGFWSIPLLTLMFLFFPGIMILVSLGAWLGHRSAQLRRLPSPQNWPDQLRGLLRLNPTNK